ncbi:MAG: ankyrin repeat domain-containing protein [Thermoanaerobaculia bacterium]
MKIRILALIALTLLVLAAAGLWTLSLMPRARPATPLARAAASGSPEELRRELEAHPPVDAKNDGFTALDWAARSGRTQVIDELVRAGADPDLRDSGPNGWTPLLHAVHKGQLEAVRALVAAGADVNLPSPKGTTPLALAAGQGEPEIVEELLAAGADPTVRNGSGWTVLQQAVGNGDPRVVQALLRKDPGLRLGHGPRDWLARTFARLGGHGDTLRLLDRREAQREASR